MCFDCSKPLASSLWTQPRAHGSPSAFSIAPTTFQQYFPIPTPISRRAGAFWDKTAPSCRTISTAGTLAGITLYGRAAESRPAILRHRPRHASTSTHSTFTAAGQRRA